MDGILTIKDDGTVVDSRTGLVYGRVVRYAGAWQGWIVRNGETVAVVYRPTRRLAAMSVATQYLTGPEN